MQSVLILGCEVFHPQLWNRVINAHPRPGLGRQISPVRISRRTRTIVEALTFDRTPQGFSHSSRFDFMSVRTKGKRGQS
jgi:uncharacterized protein (DUF2461 family)